MEIINVGLSSNKMTRAIKHQHDFWQVVLNIKGSGSNYSSNIETAFHAGTIYVCHPNTCHWKNTKKGYFQDIYINFDGVPMIQNIRNQYFEDDSEKTIEKLLLLAHNIYHKKEFGYLTIVEQLAETICTILMSWDEKDAVDPKVDLLKNILIQNATNPNYKANDAFSTISYCKDYLRKCFKKEVGMTPVEYLNHLRINHAKKLLAQNTKPCFPINEIAYLSGFYNTEYFSKVFKNYVGFSPSEYRQIKGIKC